MDTDGRRAHPNSIARLDELMREGWQLTVRDERDTPWPWNGWRAELRWINGNTCGTTRPTYAEAIDHLASAFGAKL